MNSTGNWKISLTGLRRNGKNGRFHVSKMIKNKTPFPYALFPIVGVIFISGCVYLTHFREAMFMKNLEDNQKAMQAQIEREAKFYGKLKADIDHGRLKKLTQKRDILRRYGEPTLCRDAQGQNGIKETCIYREPSGGLSAQLILLDFDSQDKLYSWDMQ